MSRRVVLAAAASVALTGQAPAEDTDVVIIGAGAAGIGAARELRRLGKRFILLEARERAGGRLHTSRALGAPFDAGGAYIHFAERNPWSGIADEFGVDAAGGHRLWSGSISYRDGVRLDAETIANRWLLLRRVGEAYEEVEGRQDVSMADALKGESQEVRDLGRIQAQMAAGEDPEWVSTADWQRLEGGQNRVVPGGYGALAERAAAPLGVRHGVKVTAIDWSGPLVTVTTEGGRIRARKAIVTVSAGVLQAGSIRFTPQLPVEHARALDGLRMGALSKVALRFEGERFGYAPHQFLAEVGDPTRALTFETWPFGSDLVLAVSGGAHARDLGRRGEREAVEEVLARFLKMVGADARKHFRGGSLPAWAEDPLSLGSYAVVLPGRMRARDVLARPLGDKVWLAGEATAGVFSMTAGGAYFAGRDAARTAAAKLSTGSLR